MMTKRRKGKVLTVTDNTKQHLKELLLACTNDPDLGVRLILKGPDATKTMFGLELSREGFEDKVVEHEGFKVLLVGPEVAQLVAGATLDTEDTPDGTKLVISREKRD